jgi:nicotinate-nucleotide adenylyltransferase
LLPPPETQPQAQRIGILGGTFDPPHNGHLLIAQQALAQLNLDIVLFAPTRQPPHKQDQSVTHIDHRLEMVRQAIEPYPRFAISRIDIDRKGPTYTVDTLRLLHQQMGDHIELFFIIGMDSLANILTWRAPDQLIQLCHLAVFNRPGFEADWQNLEAKLPGLRECVVMLTAPSLDIAASDLQKRVRAGESIARFVPDKVAEYIADRKLYR